MTSSASHLLYYLYMRVYRLFRINIMSEVSFNTPCIHWTSSNLACIDIFPCLPLAWCSLEQASLKITSELNHCLKLRSWWCSSFLKILCIDSKVEASKQICQAANRCTHLVSPCSWAILYEFQSHTLDHWLLHNTPSSFWQTNVSSTHCLLPTVVWLT